MRHRGHAVPRRVRTDAGPAGPLCRVGRRMPSGLGQGGQGLLRVPDARRHRAPTPVIGEVGLDGAARTPMESQLAALRAILEVASDTPRLLSLHSYRATGLVVKGSTEFRPHAAILHWWLGPQEETEAAVAAGAYFSINASQARSWKSLRLIPADRLLLQTDHPFGDRSESPPRRPGNLARSEIAVSTALSVSPDALRRRTWSNLKAIAETLNLVEMFPRDFQVLPDLASCAATGRRLAPCRRHR